MADVLNFPCATCGASIEFDPATAALQCRRCGRKEELPKNEKEIRELPFEEFRSRAPRKEGPGIQGRDVRCPRCGASFTLPETTIAKDCAYCGSPLVLAADAISKERIPPEAVLPFRRTLEQGREAYRAWVVSRWFAPNAFRRHSSLEKLQGIYRPFWTFDALTTNWYSGERGDYYYVGSGKDRHRETRWTYVSGTFTRHFDDVLVSAGLIPEVDSSFQLSELRPFDPKLLQGWQAETYAIEPQEGWERAKSVMHSQLLSEAERRVKGSGDDVRFVKVRTSYANVRFKHVLLPLFIGVYTYHGKKYQVQVNGQTGEVNGTRPWSVWKILLAILAVLAIAGAIALAIGKLIEISSPPSGHAVFPGGSRDFDGRERITPRGATVPLGERALRRPRRPGGACETLPTTSERRSDRAGRFADARGACVCRFDPEGSLQDPQGGQADNPEELLEDLLRANLKLVRG